MNKKALEAAAKNRLTMGPILQKSSIGYFKVPFYSDNRRLFSHPELLKIIANEMGKEILKLKKNGLKFDCLAGIPHIGVPLT